MIYPAKNFIGKEAAFGHLSANRFKNAFRRVHAAVLFWLLGFVLLGETKAADDSYDVIVFGGTPAGISAAIAASRTGVTVLLLESSNHLGGMMTAGLGASDIGNDNCIGGITREFFEQVGTVYERRIRFDFEARVAKQIFEDLLGRHKIKVERGFKLQTVEKSNNRVIALRSRLGKRVVGTVFIDATYEGDLLAESAVAFRIGRESQGEYQESLAGIEGQVLHDLLKRPISGFAQDGSLLPDISPTGPGTRGSGDSLVPAYNFRLCVTKEGSNQIPFSKPADFNETRYELLARYLEVMQIQSPETIFNFLDLPKKKYDLNNKGPISLDLIGGSAHYPAASATEREEIIRDHESYTRGLLWFLVSSPRVSKVFRSEFSKWGLCRDEFIETGNWPHQLYIREARRMIGRYVMTEHDIRSSREKADSIGVGSKAIESHHVQRYVNKEGFVQNEGFVYTREEAGNPYEIPYRALLAKPSEADNLLVPVAISATHIAFSAIRMEPMFMILGQSSGVAAGMAVKTKQGIQALPYSELREALLRDKQVLSRSKCLPKPGKRY